MQREHELTWLPSRNGFPDVRFAWPPESDAPGLLAAGGTVDAQNLLAAYSRGIFPWYSHGQPPLWWSPDPRMVLDTQDFKLHRSLKKSIQSFVNNADCEIRFDTAFAQVIKNCSEVSRHGQRGTWILPEIVAAYSELHAAGYAHSVETWVNQQLVGGLYCVAIGRAVFGESMFSQRTDASKLALAALVGFCRAQDIRLIDCQQNTPHLASLGAVEIPRAQFLAHTQRAIAEPPVAWQFATLYWRHLLKT